MKVHCRQLLTNKDGEKKKKMERKTFSGGLCGAGDRPVSGRRGEAVFSRASVFQVLLFNWQFREQ